MQRINLYPSPLTPLVNDGTGDISHGDYDVAIDNLEAGTYVFAADIQNSGTQTGINVMLFDSDWNPLFSSNKIGHVQTTFTLKKPDRVRIRPNQTGVTISNVIVERADTYALTSGGGASELLHRADRAVLVPSRRVVGDDRAESGEDHQDHRVERQCIPRHRGRADLHGDRGQSALAVVGQHRPSTADGRIHMFGCHREDVQGRVEPTSDGVTFSGGLAITENKNLWAKGLLMCAGAKVLLACRGNLLGRRLDCPPGGRRQLLRQGYGNLLALGLGVAA